MEVLYEAADSRRPPAALSQSFRELLHEDFALNDPAPDLPPVCQLESPLQHIADIAATFADDTCGRDDYIKALALGIARLHRECRSVDQDVLGIWLSCARPHQARQLVQAYQLRPQAFRALRRLLTRHRLARLLKRGLAGGDRDAAASSSFLRWVAHHFPESKGLDGLRETLGSLRSSFLYEIDQDWTDQSSRQAPAIRPGCGCPPCSEALANGLLRLGEHRTDVDPLLLRMIIHWRTWETSDQVVSAYHDLEALSDFTFSSYLENLLYKALATAGVVQLRMPDELAQAAVVSVALLATRFLRCEEAVGQPYGRSLRRWIHAAVATIFNPPLLAIAHAQESLLPVRHRARGRPRKLKLLPFLGSHSDLARHEKHGLLKKLPDLTAALCKLPARWDADAVADATRLLVQDVAYESLDYEMEESATPRRAQVRRLRHTLTQLNQISRKLPSWPRRRVVHVALAEEIVRLEKRLQSLPG
jgi:hypothetical protein